MGRRLFTKRRHEELRQFLLWLVNLAAEERVDAIVVAGDVFDSCTPSAAAQELYFHFLAEVRKTTVRHVVIVAGNHDSATLLSAPERLLKTFDIHVRSLPEESPQREVILLKDTEGRPELIVCAVPFIPEKFLRESRIGDTPEEKQQALQRGIAEHYLKVAQEASTILEKCDPPVPVVATGHLFVTGSSVTEDDGIRDLYVGSLGQLEATVFPELFDYVALGHLHVPQTVGKSEHIRYSGSPIPMSFGEAKQEKRVFLVDFQNKRENNGGFEVHVEAKPVPRYQLLEQIRGDWLKIETRLRELKEEMRDTNETVWLEIDYCGNEILPDLKYRIEKEVFETNLEVLRIVDGTLKHKGGFFSTSDSEEEFVPLEHLTPEFVFRECMKEENVPEEQQAELLEAFATILAEMEHAEEDGREDE